MQSSPLLTDQQIHPHKVTKPIQLVAAWLLGLVLLDGMFLGTAVTLDQNNWPHGLLIIAAVVNVLVFLVAIFVLQTKFRAELQEDQFYYLSKRTSQVVQLDKAMEKDVRLESLESRLYALEGSVTSITVEPSVNNLDRSDLFEWDSWRVAVNSLHPQLKEIVAALEENGIPIVEYFGNHPGAKPPSRWVVSISFSIPVELQVKLLRTITRFDFIGFSRWEPQRAADEYEDVYIGSYGTDSIVPFTSKLKNILEHAKAPKLLDDYYRNHSFNLSNTQVE